MENEMGALAKTLVPGGDVPTNVADILTAAADLIARPGAWTQGHAARDDRGQGVHPEVSTAVCWCAWGAIAKVAHDHPQRAFEVLCESLGLPDDTDPAMFGEGWNDAPGRTQAEVVAALRAAAEKARTAAEADAVGVKPCVCVARGGPEGCGLCNETGEADHDR